MTQVLVNDTSLSAIGDLIRDNINPSTEDVYIRSESLSHSETYGATTNYFLGIFQFSNITPSPSYLKYTRAVDTDYVLNEAGDKIILSNAPDYIVPAEYNRYYLNGRYTSVSGGTTYTVTALALDANKQGIRGTSSNGTLVTVDKVYKPSQMANAISGIIDDLKNNSNPLGSLRAVTLDNLNINYNDGTNISTYVTDIEKVVALMIYDSRDDRALLACPLLRPVQTASTGVKWLPLSEGRRGSSSYYYWNTSTNYGFAIVNGRTHGYYSSGSTGITTDGSYCRAFLLYTA